MKKLLIAEFRHETDSFCPQKADMEAFRKRDLHMGREMESAYRGVRNEPGAFLDVFGRREDIHLIEVLGMTAMPSGPVTAEAYAFGRGHILDAIRREQPDGVLLALHGAMVAEGHDDGEGDLLEEVRSLIGPDRPLVASLDLHANITAKMARNADALVPYEEYPHTDMYETGYVAARIIEGMLDGTCHPCMGYHRVPYLNPMFPSALPEIQVFLDMCREAEAQDGVIAVRLAHGFYPSDIEEMGMAVIALTEGDAALAQRIADRIGEAVWEGRDTLKRHFPTLDEALAMLEEPGEGPLVIADASDNPGGGGLCDTTFILREVLRRGLRGIAFGMFADPDSVRRCVEAGVGQEVDLMLGGMSDPAFSGGPVPLRARVRTLTDGFYRNRDEMNQGALNNLGVTAVVEAGGNLIIISTHRLQPYDAEIFRHCGISPERQRALVVKSAVHYRNSFGKFARRMVEVSLPGFVVPVPDGLPFRKWKGSAS